MRLFGSHRNRTVRAVRGDARARRRLIETLETRTLMSAQSQTILYFQPGSTTANSGNLVEWTATVEPAGAPVGTVPTGTVTFHTGTTVLGSAPIDDGLAVFATAALPAGSDPVTAVYSGDATYADSTSAPTVVTVTGPAAMAPRLTPTVSDARLPAATLIGAKTKFSLPVAITNTGQSNENGVVRVVLYASPDSVLDQNATVVGTALRVKLGIRPGKSQKVTLHETEMPAGLAAGSYHLLAQVFDASGFAQTAVTVARIELSAPLIAPAVTFDAGPATIIPGEKHAGKFTVTITNDGNVPSAGTTRITAYLTTDGAVDSNALLIDEVGVGVSLPAGKSKKISLPLSSVPAGLDGLYQLVLILRMPSANSAPAVDVTAVDPAEIAVRG